MTHSSHQGPDHRTDAFALFITYGLVALCALWALVGCGAVGDSDRSSGGPGRAPDWAETEPNDFVTEPDYVPFTLTPGTVIVLEGELGGDTINALGQPGTRDWFRLDAQVPTTVNVRLWIDGPAYLSLNLVEWLDENTYRLRNHDFTETGYSELTIEVAALAAGSGLGIGIMEGSNSALEGTAYTLEVMAL
jgi:hypothetical protein